MYISAYIIIQIKVKYVDILDQSSACIRLSEWISNVTCRCLCSVSSVKMRCDCSHWWPSLFKLSFRNLIIWNTFSACPSSEWILNGGICYLADEAVSRSWDDAVLYCIAINSLLVHPKTYVEKDFVYSLLHR